MLKMYVDLRNNRNDSYLQLTTSDNLLTLRRLETYANRRNFVEEPLIFLNACESVAMSPLFYDGFILYFMAKKGSRGIIGTISRVPACFASEFAIRFFDGC